AFCLTYAFVSTLCCFSRGFFKCCDLVIGMLELGPRVSDGRNSSTPLLRDVPVALSLLRGGAEGIERLGDGALIARDLAEMLLGALGVIFLGLRGRLKDGERTRGPGAEVLVKVVGQAAVFEDRVRQLPDVGLGCVDSFREVIARAQGCLGI